MKRSEINRKATLVEEMLGDLPAGQDGMPMPHDSDRRRISCEEWQEWIQRLDRQRHRDPEYETLFCRAADATVTKAWDLLNPPPTLAEAINPRTDGFMSESSAVDRRLNARTAFIMALGVWVGNALCDRRVTFVDVVDVAAAAFSPHYLCFAHVISSIRQMSMSSISNCRRDLLLRGVLIDYIYDEIRRWDTNPLFVQRVEKTGDEIVITPNLRPHSTILRRFLSVIERDAAFEHGPGRRLRLKMATERKERLAAPGRTSSERRQRQDVCADRPYNVVELNERGECFLQLQEEATLYFEPHAFRKDYNAAERTAKRMEKMLLRKYGVRAWLSTYPRPVSQGSDENKTNASDKVRKWTERDVDIRNRSYVVGLLMADDKGAAHTIEQTDVRDTETYEMFRAPINLKDKEERDRYQKEREKYWRRLSSFKRYLEKRRDVEEEDKRSARIISEDSATIELHLGKLRDDAERVQCLIPETPEDLWLLDRSCRAWRNDVRNLLNEYDAAKLHLSTFAEVSEQVKERKGPIPVRTRFGYTLNRRFQPRYLWPTHVTSRRSWAAPYEEDTDFRDETWADEEKPTALRDRWFKCRDPMTGAIGSLAGRDVSSSQMQILALFLSDEKLEQDTMGSDDRSFKEIMAESALNFTPKILNKGYNGPEDKRLQNLVKELLMRVSYGSSPGDTENYQYYRPLEFGPCWTRGGAGVFYNWFTTQYPRVDEFRRACRQVASVAVARDPCSGVLFRDPATGVDVRWNPVKLKEKNGYVYFGERNKKAYFLVPDGEPNCEGDYPVDENKLRKMVMPCLVQMLDAFYSGLVMQELHKMGCVTLVGIHDCWLVPKSRISILEQAMQKASVTWYAGLGPVYENLLRYLNDDARYAPLLEEAQQQWERRQRDNVPTFKAKDVHAKQQAT